MSKKGEAYCPECVEACLDLVEESGNNTHKLFATLANEIKEAARKSISS